MEAQWTWRQFPRQIASDLSEFHHRRIADWHSGAMSSYELLELLEFMNERGAFKTAMRGGSWTWDQMVAAESYNETARTRASYHAVNGGEKGAYEPYLLVDPRVQRDLDEQSRDLDALRREAEEDLFEEFDW